jgi:hypothetical protein
MGEKQITWINQLEATVKVLDGVAKGEYKINIEDACAGLITLGYLPSGQRIAIKTDDISEFQERYDKSPRALNIQRQDLVDEINGSLDEARQLQDKSYESGEGTGAWIYAGDEWRERAKAAKVKLENFDVIHPEIIAEIKRIQKENVEKHFWD